jgi:hypothetical protein
VRLEEKGALEKRRFLCTGVMSERACAQVVFGAGESSSQHACAGKNTALLMLFVLLVRLVQVPAHAPMPWVLIRLLSLWATLLQFGDTE